PGAVSDADRAAERDDGPAQQDAQRLPQQRAADAVGGPRGARHPRRGDGAARLPRARHGGRAAGRRPAVRHAQARGAGACAGRASPAPARGRAGRRPQPRGGRRSRQAHQDHPRAVPRHRPAGRAPHGTGDADLRQSGGARFRPQDRRGHAGRSPAQSRRHPRLPGRGRARRRGEPLMALLEVKNLEAQYGWTKVLHGLSFDVEEGGITTILGANGAGKTTTLRAVCGMVKTRGEVRFDGRAISGRATEDVVRLGIAHVPEGRGTFVNLTVEENLRLGAYARGRGGSLAEDLDKAYRYFPVLAERRAQLAGTLSGGEQQMLAVARGLML